MTPPAVIREYLNGVSPLPEALLVRIEGLLTRKDYAARDHTSPLGVVQKTVGILESGVVRAYYPTPQGREYNGHLYFAPAFIGDYTSIITGQPVAMPQQALVPSVVWSFPFAVVAPWESEFPELNRFRRVFAESMYLLKERREVELVSFSAAERYRHLRRRVPGIDDLLPQYEIAAYLGITPSELSRIRNRRR